MVSKEERLCEKFAKWLHSNGGDKRDAGEERQRSLLRFGREGWQGK